MSGTAWFIFIAMWLLIVVGFVTATVIGLKTYADCIDLPDEEIGEGIDD